MGKPELDLTPTALPGFGSDNQRVLAVGDISCVVKITGEMVCWGDLLRFRGVPGTKPNECGDIQRLCGPLELFPACVPR